MTEAIQHITLRAKWKKILKGKPTSKDLKNYIRDIELYQMNSQSNTQLV